MKAETYIYIDNMRLHAYHGVLDQERMVGNDYLINVKIGYNWLKAAKTDDVNDTVNYAAIAEIVMEQMAIPSALLEHVAGRTAEMIYNQFPQCSTVDIQIKKLAPPMACDCDGAGVRIILTDDRGSSSYMKDSCL